MRDRLRKRSCHGAVAPLRDYPSCCQVCELPQPTVFEALDA